MITRGEIQKIVSKYEKRNVTIGILGSHSALELGMSAKALGAKTVIIVEEGRDEIYVQDHDHLYDYIIKVKKFKELLKSEIQEKLIKLNTVFVPNRSFSVYVGYDGIEKEFKVPIYGNRFLLRAEDRKDEKGQYYLLKKAGIRVPAEFKAPEEIERLAIVKVQRADNPLERSFFYPRSAEDYHREFERYKMEAKINDEGLANARIEEYVLGARFNANFHKYALNDIFGDLDFTGLSDRRQVNLQGFLNLPAREQLKIDEPVTNEEIGHYGVTIRESKQPLFWTAAKRFVKTVEKEYPPGIIGLFGMQGAIAYNSNKKSELEFVVFDVSLRIPGDPAIGPTSPEMRNLTLKHGRRIEDPLDLTVIEILRAAELARVTDIVT